MRDESERPWEVTIYGQVTWCGQRSLRLLPILAGHICECWKTHHVR
jgi:hypothetical protein